MKKSNLNLAATVMICGAFLFSSCIGSFGLHSKLVNWNQSIGTKFVNELVYLAWRTVTLSQKKVRPLLWSWFTTKN